MQLKWGIISTGNCSSEFTNCLNSLSNEEHTIVAVAAQDFSRARAFAKKYKIPICYGTYEKLAKDRNVEIVHIGNLNIQHFEVSRLMLENGKHVLCEKPMTMNEKQTRKLIEIARERNLFLMEGIWSRCFPLYKELRTLLDQQILGEILYVSATFGKPLQHIDRIREKRLGGGTILDLGVYLIQFVQFVFRGLDALEVNAVGHSNEYGVDESCSAVITFPGGKIANISSHSALLLPNEAEIVGKKGRIVVPQFWCPLKLITPMGTKHFDLPEVDPSIQFMSKFSKGYIYEIQEVWKCLKAGMIECPKMTHVESIKLVQLMDKMRKDVGIVYPDDLVKITK
ncbi:trans-1,2-dihydrobenzene-1,2-diol dehydrogenase-like [Agrilus planipennis]|uniref:Trans-1,2-dihydrobenzene-1,2-diol dehydrogenase n=1 Tax=Agrilus planipennis TaxID=224129 RepID=A0A1W4XIC7_AGRPL|nr:trans-1,2-dihydrobenzene-1,2-diol dehydrogenase-like [Agrilus planipennis]